jgi:protein-S-isoprenylcysteine O-methyltransferase Ste14
MNRLWIALRALVYGALFVALWTWVALLCRVFDKYLPLQLPKDLGVSGWVLVLAGGALCLTTFLFFIFEGRGTPAIFDPPKRFVPHGPYQFIRNPMYLGYVGVLFGLGLCHGSVSMVLFAGIAYLLMHTYVVLAEESGLRKRFGAQYEDYCHVVPRWIPRLTRQRVPR